MFALKCIEPESEIILKCEDIKQEEDVQDREKSLLADVKEELLTEFEIKTEYSNDSIDENFADCAYEQETIAIHPAEDILDVEFDQTISKRKQKEETNALKALLAEHNYFNNKRINLDVTKTLDSETVPSFHHNTQITNDSAVVFPTEGDSQQPPPPWRIISSQAWRRARPLGTCKYCGKTFSKICYLEDHLRNHIGARLYQCPEPGCGVKFGSLVGLGRHTWSHNTTSRFKCQVCDKRFNRADCFKVHIAKCSLTNAVSTAECIGGMDTGEVEGKPAVHWKLHRVR